MDQDIVDLNKEFRTLEAPPQITNKVAQIGSQLNEMGRALAGLAACFSSGRHKETERLDLALGELSGLLSPAHRNPSESANRRKQKFRPSKRASPWTPPTHTTLPADAAGATVSRRSSVAASAAFSIQKWISSGPNCFRWRRAVSNWSTGSVRRNSYVANPPGEARVFAPASLKTVHTGHRRWKIALASAVGGCLGLACSFVLVLLVEFGDGRLKTAADLKRVTQLPVLTTLGDVQKMGPEAQSQWAFRTWTLLQGHLSPTAHHGLVCGFTSSSQGEGRSTWIRLLAEAASLTGFRVLTVATRPPTSDEKSTGNHACDLLPDALEAKDPGDSLMPRDTDALSSPDQITDRLTDPNARPVVHIPLPGWVWNRERRQQWHTALEHWRKIENIVILVELPPANMPETVLLGSSLPNLIWLADSNVA